MPTLKKFDYVVDPNHVLISSAHVLDEYLDTLCPVLVGGLRAIADRESSAMLYLSVERIKQDIAEAKLFLAVSTSELAKRYSSNTLEPELHTGGEESEKYAKHQVAQEPGATETDGDWIDESGAGVSSVNSVADGIA
jgi:hypothetical protein